MGFLDTLDGLELSDEVKEQLRQEHSSEIEPRDSELAEAKREARRTSVEQEIEGLGNIGLSDPGIAKFVRRVFLSDDEDVGIVLLSDADLQLSGDEAVGARDKQEMSAAGVLREFISLLPKNQEGKLDLGSMALSDDAGDPPEEDDDDPDKSREERKKSTENWMGHPVTRTRSRYAGARARAAGGES